MEARVLTGIALDWTFQDASSIFFRQKGRISYHEILTGNIENAEKIILSYIESEHIEVIKETKGHLTINLGYVEYEKGNYDNAKKYYLKAMELVENGDARGYFEANHALALLSIEQNDLSSARMYYERASEILNGISYSFELARLHELRGSLHSAECKWEEAENEFEEALKISEGIIARYLQPIIYYRYGQMFQQKGEPSLAREKYEKALAAFRDYGMKLWTKRAEEALMDC